MHVTTAAVNNSNKEIKLPRKIYRPPLPSLYKEPNLGPDCLLHLEWVAKPHGLSLWKEKTPLPPRADIRVYCRADEPELLMAAKVDHLEPSLRKQVIEIIQEYWDVFWNEGVLQPIRGYQFTIDTGDATPVCCRQPRYGAFESPIIQKQVDALKHNGVLEKDEGPWGSQNHISCQASPRRHSI